MFRIMTNRALIYFGASGLLMSLALTGCSKKEEKKKDDEKSPISIRTDKAKKRQLRPSFEVIGTVLPVPEKYATLTALAPGLIEKLVVQEGDKIKEHALIIQLDPREAQNALNRAEAAYTRLIAKPRPEELSQAKGTVVKMRSAHDSAVTRLNKSRELRARNPELVPEVQWLDDVRNEQTARVEWEMAESQLELLQKGPRDEVRKESYVEVEAAKLHLEFCQVTAPFAGEVVEMKARVGQRADVGTPLATILDSSEVIVQARIPSHRLQEIEEALNDPEAELGSVKCDTLSKKSFPIKSGWLSRQTENMTGDVPIKLRISNPQGCLRVGMTVQVELHGSEREVLTVPEKALTVNEDGKYVVTLVKDGLASPAEVELAPEGGREFRAEGFVQISKGIEEGDEVAIENGYGLPEKTAVAILPPEEAKSEH